MAVVPSGLVIDGIPVYIEVAEVVEGMSTIAQGGGLETADTAAEMAARLLEKLEIVGRTAAGTCKRLYTYIKADLGETWPDELSLEFSVTLAGELGIPLVTKGSVEGAFKVTAKWKREPA